VLVPCCDVINMHVNQVLVCFHFGLTGQTDMLMTSQQGINTYVCVSTPQHVNQVLVCFHFEYLFIQCMILVCCN
jgi:hypothetical protein